MPSPRTARPSKPSGPPTLQQQQAQATLLRVGVLAALLALFVLPLVPSPLGGVAWWPLVWEQIGPLLRAPFPDPAIGMPVPTLPAQQWLIWGLAAAGLYLVWSMVLHLVSLYRQRTAPLTQTRTYLRLRTPLGLKLRPADGLGLLRTLHGVLPRSGLGAPLVLRWTAQPEQAAMQGVSLLGGPTLTTSVQKTLEGLGGGTQADVRDDPLLAACLPGRLLCWAEVRLAAPGDLPIASAKAETPLVDALLPALAPQRGVFASDVQIMVRPVGDRGWRVPVLARLEASKGDAGSSERTALEQKAAGPGFAVCVRLLAVAATPDGGAAMVQTLAAALAASAQAVGQREQRLVAGPVRCLPAVLPPPPPLSARARLALALMGLAVALASASVVMRDAPGAPQLWALPPLLGLLPWALVATHHYRRRRGREWQQLRTLLQSVPPPRNPRVIPLWSDWFGHREG